MSVILRPVLLIAFLCVFLVHDRDRSSRTIENNRLSINTLSSYTFKVNVGIQNTRMKRLEQSTNDNRNL